MRALQVDYGRGELHRSAVAAPTLAELAGDYVAHLETRVGDRDPKRRRSARTVADVRYKLDRYVLPVIGGIRADDVAAADVLRLLDRLAALRLSPNTRTGLVSNVSGLLRYGVKRGLVERNVVRDVDRDDRPLFVARLCRLRRATGTATTTVEVVEAAVAAPRRHEVARVDRSSRLRAVFAAA